MDSTQVRRISRELAYVLANETEHAFQNKGRWDKHVYADFASNLIYETLLDHFTVTAFIPPERMK